MVERLASLVIGGRPYHYCILRDTPLGRLAYSIGSDHCLTDRFYRNYIVTAQPDGRPMKCSCPDCYHKQNWCKHLRAIEQWWRENTDEGKRAQRQLEQEVALRGLCAAGYGLSEGGCEL